MSFILDALKKSETDRQRQTGPALFEVKVAPPKAGFPVWAIAIVVLLVINMVIVGWMLLRRSSKAEEAAAQNTPPPAVASQPASAAPPGPTPASMQAQVPNNNGPQQGYNPPATQQVSSPPGTQQGYGQPGTQQNMPPQAAGSNGNAQGAEPDEQALQRRAARAVQDEPTLGGGGTNNARPSSNGSMSPPTARAGGAESNADGASGNPDDDAPAQDPGSPLFKGHVKRGTASGLMLYQDLAVTNGANLPELRLDMHVYDPKPQARFALINMHKVTEGQMAGNGVKVEAITPEGVVLSHNGTKFLLPRE